MRLRVTCISAKRDKEFLIRLSRHLFGQNLLEEDYCIVSIVPREILIEKIKEAAILIVLLSADFFFETCEIIIDEIKFRIANETGIVIPIYIGFYKIPQRYSCFQDIDWLPSKNSPVDKSDNDKAWTYIVSAICRVAHAMRDYDVLRPGCIPKISQPPCQIEGELRQLTSHYSENSHTILTRPQIRQVLQQSLPTISQFNAFCLDYFPEVMWLFSEEMNRIHRTNLLLENVDCKKIRLKLQEFLCSGSSRF